MNSSILAYCNNEVIIGIFGALTYIIILSNYDSDDDPEPYFGGCLVTGLFFMWLASIIPVNFRFLILFCLLIPIIGSFYVAYKSENLKKNHKAITIK